MKTVFERGDLIKYRNGNDVWMGYVHSIDDDGDVMTERGVLNKEFCSLTNDDKEQDKQVGGNHYAKQKIQPIDYIMANNLGFCEGNVIKYITRYKDKNGKEDLLKTRQYIDFLLKEMQ